MQQSTHPISETWGHIRTDVKRAWNRLSEEELEKTKGDFKKIIELVEHRYGESKDNYQNALMSIFKKFGSPGLETVKKPSPKQKRKKTYNS